MCACRRTHAQTRLDSPREFGTSPPAMNFSVAPRMSSYCGSKSKAVLLQPQGRMILLTALIAFLAMVASGLEGRFGTCTLSVSKVDPVALLADTVLPARVQQWWYARSVWMRCSQESTACGDNV